jgi:hypothetical protein
MTFGGIPALVPGGAMLLAVARAAFAQISGLCGGSEIHGAASLRADLRSGLPLLVFLVVNSKVSPGSASLRKSWLPSRGLYWVLLNTESRYFWPVARSARQRMRLADFPHAFCSSVAVHVPSGQSKAYSFQLASCL